MRILQVKQNHEIIVRKTKRPKFGQKKACWSDSQVSTAKKLLFFGNVCAARTTILIGKVNGTKYHLKSKNQFLTSRI